MNYGDVVQKMDEKYCDISTTFATILFSGSFNWLW